MNRLFLGKPVHWLIAAVLIGFGWLAGRVRLHVTDFNMFVIVLFVISAIALLLVLTTTKRNEQVTRDQITDEDDD
ncbi:MAG: hypothetical protein WD969_05690 [Paracoccaceae bacterium]